MPIRRPPCQYSPEAFPLTDLRIDALFSTKQRITKEIEKRNEK